MSHFLTGPVENAEDVVCGRVRVVVGLVLLEAEDHEAQHEQVDRGRVARQAEQEKDEGTTDVTRTELEYESKRTRLGIPGEPEKSLQFFKPSVTANARA